jgi:hypothetical protein
VTGLAELQRQLLTGPEVRRELNGLEPIYAVVGEAVDGGSAEPMADESGDF